MQRINWGGAKLLVAVIMALLPASLSADIIVFQGDNPPFGGLLANASFTNNDTGVIITGTVAGGDVNVTNGATVLEVQGQQIQADDGSDFNFITIQTDPGFIFTIVSFNLNVSADGIVTFTTAPNGIDPPTSPTYAVDAAGENRFTLYALGGQSLASVFMSLDTGGIQDIKQIRASIRSAGTPNPLGDPVIPEPSTWVLMSAGVACLLVRRRIS